MKLDARAKISPALALCLSVCVSLYTASLPACLSVCLFLLTCCRFALVGSRVMLE
jgi:hypothetical protein